MTNARTMTMPFGYMWGPQMQLHKSWWNINSTDDTMHTSSTTDSERCTATKLTQLEYDTIYKWWHTLLVLCD